MLTGLNIEKSFGTKKVLCGAMATVEAGKITVLIGPSGGGKTTLLRALALLDPPDRGTIAINDVSYTFPLAPNVQIRPPWPQVTAVFQQLFLWPHMTLRQNIMLPLKNLGTNHYKDKVEELVELFEMNSFIDNYPNEASLGQQQRVALARSLVLEPSYILLDEITSALDVEQVSRILTYLQTLKEHGIGILIITHLMGFARRAADWILFLDQGRILEQGDPRLLDAPNHERVHRFLSVIEAAH